MDRWNRAGWGGAPTKELLREAEAVECAAEGGGEGGDVPGRRASIEGGHDDFALEAWELTCAAGNAHRRGVAPIASDDLVEFALVEAGDQVVWLGDVELVEHRGRRMAGGSRGEHEGAIAGPFEEEGARTRDQGIVDRRWSGLECGDRLGGLDEGELAGKRFERKGVGRRELDANHTGGRRVDPVEGGVSRVALGERGCARAGELQGTKEMFDGIGGGDGAGGEPGSFVPASGGVDVEEEGAVIWLFPAGGQARAKGGSLEVGPFDKAGVGAAEDLNDRRLAGAPGIEGVEVEAPGGRDADGAAAGERGRCGRGRGGR